MTSLIINSINKVAVIILVALLYMVVGLQTASAQVIPEIELGGYAWSSNIGWISLNCATGGNDGADAGQVGDDVCASSNYKVTVEATTGNITGYAWSSNIGWIRFGGLSSFLSPAPGNAGGNARVVGTYPNLTLEGWARACAGTASPAGACGNMTNNPDAGGWDGWISLRGTSHSININNFGTAQYAWGSTNVGWVDMSTRASIATVRSNLTIDAFDRSGTAVESGGVVNDVRFNASVTGAPTGVTMNYSLQSGAQTLNGTYRDDRNPRFSPTLELDGLNYGTGQTATLRIDLPQPGVLVESDGNAANGNEEVDGNSRTTPAFDLNPTPPVITLNSDRTNSDRVTIRPGETVTLDWSITALYDVTCDVQGNVAGSPSVGHLIASGTNSSGSFSSAALTSQSEIRIVCNSVAGTVTRSVLVDMIPNVQEI